MSVRTIRVATRIPYDVHVGPGALARLPDLVEPERRSAVLSDENVAPLHAARLGARAAPLLAVPAGERSKSLCELERVLDFLAASALDRRSLLIVLGGGVPGDLGGLAASLYQRGIALLQCPTSLLAQVDASVGGKTAVNLAAGKNLAGTFHQPMVVLADTETLSTLPDEEFRSGLGEVLKSALIGDGELLARLEEDRGALLARDPELLAEIVARCVAVKAAIVARDEEERGERAVLNLGHTFAHAIERCAGFGKVPHGVAVGTGLALALAARERAGVLLDPALPARASALLRALELVPDLAGLRERYAVALDADELARAMRTDKKGRGGRPTFVLPRRIGSIAVEQELEPGLLRELLA